MFSSFASDRSPGASRIAVNGNSSVLAGPCVQLAARAVQPSAALWWDTTVKLLRISALI
jgi:hypothetical protein